MKKLGLLVMPLMIPLIASCNSKTITITWVNYDDEVLEVDENVKKGTMPTYDGPIPERPSEGECMYIFDGWSPKLEPVSKSTTYKAVYTSGYNTIIDISIPESSDNDYEFKFDYTLVEGKSIKVDWGDGKTDETNSHTYTASGNYTIIIENIASLAMTDGYLYITSVHLGDYVSSVPDDAFNGCSNMTEITIPDSVTSMGEYALNMCSSLIKISISDNIDAIRYQAISNCYKLESIKLPENLVSIENDAFALSSLKSIIIPKKVSSIGSDSELGQQPFNWCTSLASIEVDKENPNYDSRDDSNAIITSKDITIGEKRYPKDTLISGCCNTTIPNTVTSIGAAAFLCSSLKSITIPNSVTSIGFLAFAGCDSLTQIDLTNYEDSLNIPTAGSSAFPSNLILEVANEGMANAFKNKGGGWPNSLDKYHWPDKSSINN